MKSDTNFFNGKVRYTSITHGTVSWKMGGLCFRQDENGWRINVVYNVNPDRSVLTMKLTPANIKKVLCKENTFHIEISGSDRHYVTIRLCTHEKNALKNLESLVAGIQRPKTSVAISRSDVGVPCTLTPQKTNGSNTCNSQQPMDDYSNKENTSPQQFTSVKSSTGSEVKRIPNILATPTSDSSEKSQFTSVKKNVDTLTLPSQSFYSQSKPSFKASYSRPLLSSKRMHNLSDTTPSKRRLSDSISYSMKSKPVFKPVEHKQLPQEQKPTMVGFSNMGNTCYINAVLQSLLCIESLSSDLLANRKLLKNLSSSSLYYCLVKLLHMKRQSLQTTDKAKTDLLLKIKAAISATAERFSGNEQHDAHEFLCRLLDILKEEVNKLSNSTPSPVKENNNNNLHINDTTYTNPVSANFEFEVLHTLTCKRCQDQMTKTEQLVDIPLQFPKRKDILTPRSLQDALTMFFKDETVDHACEKCGHQQKSVSHRITRLPRVFILQLKRYIFNQVKQRNTKMGIGVNVPLYLTLQIHCTEETFPAPPPLLVASCDSDNVTSPVPEDCREDVSSRRRLAYPSSNLKSDDTSLTPGKQSTDDHSFTSTKNRMNEEQTNGEVDKDMETAIRLSHEQLEKSRYDLHNQSEDVQNPPQNIGDPPQESVSVDPPSVITLEDEDNEQLSKAIELSLRDEEERNKFVQDYGGDDEMQRVMEMSIISFHESEGKVKLRTPSRYDSNITGFNAQERNKTNKKSNRNVDNSVKGVVRRGIYIGTANKDKRQYDQDIFLEDVDDGKRTDARSCNYVEHNRNSCLDVDKVDDGNRTDAAEESNVKHSGKHVLNSCLDVDKGNRTDADVVSNFEHSHKRVLNSQVDKDKSTNANVGTKTETMMLAIELLGNRQGNKCHSFENVGNNGEGDEQAVEIFLDHPDNDNWSNLCPSADSSVLSCISDSFLSDYSFVAEKVVDYDKTEQVQNLSEIPEMGEVVDVDAEQDGSFSEIPELETVVDDIEVHNLAEVPQSRTVFESFETTCIAAVKAIDDFADIVEIEEEESKINTDERGGMVKDVMENKVKLPSGNKLKSIEATYKAAVEAVNDFADIAEIEKESVESRGGIVTDEMGNKGKNLTGNKLVDMEEDDFCLFKEDAQVDTVVKKYKSRKRIRECTNVSTRRYFLRSKHKDSPGENLIPKEGKQLYREKLMHYAKCKSSANFGLNVKKNYSRVKMSWEEMMVFSKCEDFETDVFSVSDDDSDAGGEREKVEDLDVVVIDDDSDEDDGAGRDDEGSDAGVGRDDDVGSDDDSDADGEREKKEDMDVVVIDDDSDKDDGVGRDDDVARDDDNSDLSVGTDGNDDDDNDGVGKDDEDNAEAGVVWNDDVGRDDDNSDPSVGTDGNDDDDNDGVGKDDEDNAEAGVVWNDDVGRDDDNSDPSVGTDGDDGDAGAGMDDDDSDAYVLIIEDDSDKYAGVGRENDDSDASFGTDGDDGGEDDGVGRDGDDSDAYVLIIEDDSDKYTGVGREDDDSDASFARDDKADAAGRSNHQEHNGDFGNANADVFENYVGNKSLIKDIGSVDADDNGGFEAHNDKDKVADAAADDDVAAEAVEEEVHGLLGGGLMDVSTQRQTGQSQRLANQSTEDKENTTPLSDRPRLSDPSDFEADYNDDGGIDEVDGFVDESLDLPDIRNETGDKPFSYRLVSVVKHEGVSSLTGHYTSDVYNFKKKAWYKCDDKHVTRVSEAEVKRRGETDGYIFFYMSKDVFEDISINHDLNTTNKS